MGQGAQLAVTRTMTAPNPAGRLTSRGNLSLLDGMNDAQGC